MATPKKKKKKKVAAKQGTKITQSVTEAKKKKKKKAGSSLANDLQTEAVITAQNGKRAVNKGPAVVRGCTKK